MDEIEVVVVRVFTDERGTNGIELGIVTSSPATAQREQAIAAALGFSETVFIDRVDAVGRLATIRIFTPAGEFPFAGHPSVGAAWWLAHEHTPVDLLREKVGDVLVATDLNKDSASIEARADWAPAFVWLPLARPTDVDALDPFSFDFGQHYAYAWIDEEAGLLRARMCAPARGIVEHEATGAAAVALTAKLDRALHIVQGAGSALITTPLGDGRIRLGGTVVYDRVITVSL